MKITTWPHRPAMGTSVTAIVAAGLVAGAAALVPTLGAGHASLNIRQVAMQAAAVTTTMQGPVSPTAVPLRQGPGSGYPAAGYAQAFTPYAIGCFSTTEVSPGAYGPYFITDMSTVWYKLHQHGHVAGQRIYPGDRPREPIQHRQFRGSQRGWPVRCRPAPAGPPASANGEAVGAAQPVSCARGIPVTDGSTTTITVHSTSGHLDVEFDAALWPMSVDVQDLTTGQSGSGTALDDPKATWHFTEDQQTTFGDHKLMITVDGDLGGPVPDTENPGAPPSDGDNAVSDVSWENLSDNCVP